MENDEKTAELEQHENETQEEVAEETQDTSEQSEETSHEDDKDWKAEALKYKAILERNKNKKPEVREKRSVTPELDNATLARIYNIHEDDIDEVLDMAKFKKVSLAEALKLGATKAILAEKEEFRRTANASNIGNTRRATSVSPDTLVRNLSEGKVPEKGSKEAEDLFWAKRGGKR